MEKIKVWMHNVKSVEEAVLTGKEMKAEDTQYGANEFAVDFLIRSGIWKHLLVKPVQGKENGKDWKKKAGIAILSELLHLGHLSKADKVIKDAKLMVELGFTFEEVDEAKGSGGGVIHRDTIRNYFKCVPCEKSIEEYYEFVNCMRRKRWIRGKTYAADGFEIEVYGKSYEGMGKVYDEEEKRWKYGYKMVMLMNVEEERERIVGFAIGPINSNERELLLKILEDLEKRVVKVKDIIDTIILDRGYWGYEFLENILSAKYHLNYVLIAKKSFTFVKEDMRDLIDSGRMEFMGRRLYNKTRKEWDEVKVAYAKDIYHGYVSKAQPYLGKVNVVVMKKMEKGEEKEIFYVTNRKVKDPLRIVELYASRWTIENQGFRELSQKWLIRIPGGRKMNSITARICLILKLYNAMKIMEMKHGKEWEKNKEEIEAWGERSYIGGQGIVIYSQNYFAPFTADKFKELIEKRTRMVTLAEERKLFINEIEKLKHYLPRDRVSELLKKLSL